VSLLREPGDLARAPIAALLLEALNARATGALTVTSGGAASRVFVREGVPVGAQTFSAFRPLGQVLLSAGIIGMEALGKSLQEMARTGRSQGEVLVAMGVATAADVERALSEQQAGYLGAIALLGEGTFAFAPGEPPGWTRGVRIAPLRAIVQALEAAPAAALVESALEPVRAPVALAPGYARLGRGFGWSPAEAALVGRLAAPTSLDGFFREPGVPEGRARAMLSALLLLGLATPAGAAPRPADAWADVEDLEHLVVPPGPPRAPTPVPVTARALEEARERRRRLLSRAMQNLGVGPLAGEPRPAPDGAPRSAAGAAPPAAGGADAALRAELDRMLARAKDPDLFHRLGLPRSATREEVKAAWFALAKRFHPDRFAGPGRAELQQLVQELFAALNEAYEALSDDARRAALSAGAAPAATAGATDPRAAAIDYQKGEACLRTRDVARARGFFEAAARADPRGDHLAALAWVLATAAPQDKARATQLLGQALRDRRSARAPYVAGMLARMEGNDAAAERHFRATLALDPGHAEAQRELRGLEARRARSDRLRE
jgi:hypothetical protein